MQHPINNPSLSARRLAPLAAAVLLAFSHVLSANPAATVVVQNCNDHGTGSLRKAVSSAATGSTIDLSQLSCSTISLSSGSIEIPQASLFLTGPGATKLTVDGGASSQHYNRVFHHTGTGSLSISGLTVSGGKYRASTVEAEGACIYSKGPLTVSESSITGCFAIASANVDAKGGAIFAEKGITLLNSSVTSNLAQATGTGSASGGGIYAFGPVTIKYGVVSNNSADGTGGAFVSGGGVEMLDGDFVMFDSAVANNYSGGSDAGILIGHSNGSPSHSALIVNSTISSNEAGSGVGGLRTQNSLTLANSTVAFNNSGSLTHFGAGVQLQAPLNLQSSIIAENFGDDGDDDLYTGNQTVTGANNLVTEHTGNTAPPADTITACPLLGRLSDNGGPTPTHRLLTNSPAIDAGNNDTGFGGNPLVDDQRGSGHPRTYNMATDIGAFEYAGGLADEIFRSGFEGRCR